VSFYINGVYLPDSPLHEDVGRLHFKLFCYMCEDDVSGVLYLDLPVLGVPFRLFTQWASQQARPLTVQVPFPGKFTNRRLKR
jgi:hypothetical protein